ncbi:hypothetical protein BJV82DRAFT_608380 [Fennellomyces sp. T-0311]|nr:hypothetical protein BJV82DRAFT_608380 [Fennellomyces sp. T-0311]
MQPAEPMAMPDNNNNNQEIPVHIPPQMVLAPEQRPYEQTHIIRREDFEDDEVNRSNLSRHSLSPEQLGVVGYVKDVAGFVKDAVQTSRANKKASKESSTMSSSPPPERRSRTIESSSSSSSTLSASPPPERRTPTPLAEAVTNLFPQVDPTGSGCTHADELRHDLMRTSSRESGDSHKLVHE